MLLKRYPQETRVLVGSARQLIRGLLPKIEESTDSSAPVIGYRYGPGWSGLVCTLILSKSGVKLGLVGGADLNDPHGLLRGAGRVHRYIQLHAPEDLHQVGVSRLIVEARTVWEKRTSANVPS